MQLWLRRTVLGVFGASALGGGAAACSHPFRHDGWHTPNDEEAAKFKSRAIERIADKLQLGAEQRNKLAALADRLHDQHRALRGSGDPRAELQSLVSDAHFDRWHAQDLVNARLQAVRQHSPAVIAAMAAFYDGLGPTQQQLVRDFLKRRPECAWGRTH